MPISINRATIYCDGLDHPECLCIASDGTLYAGGESGQIYRVQPQTKQVEQLAITNGFILGLALSPDQSWLAACDLRHQCVWKLDLTTGKRSVFAGGMFSIPNHVAFTRDGSLFVSDSGGFRETTGRVFRFDAGGRGGVWHAGPFNFANGIALGPGHDSLYICCSWLPGVERVSIRADGSAGRRTVYAKLPTRTVPDGLAFGADGTLYVSCYAPARIYRISRERKVDVLIDDWEAHTLANPTNIAFGGPRHDQLFVANLGRWHVTQIDLRRRGLLLAHHMEGGE